MHQTYQKNINPLRKIFGRKRDVRNFLRKAFPYFSKKPFNIIIHANDICNSRCTTCYIWKNEDKEQLSVEKIDSVINDIFSITGPRTVTISGGEPLLRSDIYQIIQGIKKRNGSVRLLTNGLLLTPLVIKKLHESKLDCVVISLNSTDPAIHDRSRGMPGNHQRIMEAVNHINEQYPDMQIDFTCILFKENLEEVPHLVTYAKSKGATMSFQPIRPILYGNRYLEKDQAAKYFSELLPDSNEKTSKALQMLEDTPSFGEGIFLPKSYIKLYRSYFNDPYHPSKKKVDDTFLFIRHNGIVQFNTRLPAIGNIHDSSIKDILSGEEARRQLSDCYKEEVCLCEINPKPRDFYQVGKDALVHVLKSVRKQD